MNTDYVNHRIEELENKYHKKFKNIIDEFYYIDEDGEIFSYYSNGPKKLKPFLREDGYLQIKLYHVHYKIHRLVAECFIPNHEDYRTIVNHKDGNKTNNNYHNLEWTTYKENNYHAWETHLNLSPRAPKWCCMLDKNNNILDIFQSISDLSRFYGVDNSTASKQCRGLKNQFATGCKARYYDIESKTFIPTKFD